MEELTYQQAATKASGEVLEHLSTSSEHGLSGAEAVKRRVRFGANVVASETPSVFTLLARQILSPLALLLIGAAALSFTAGARIDALVILAIFSANAILSFAQEFHAEVATKKLMRKLMPNVAVTRDGKLEQVPARDLVPGDIIHLVAGDVVPADARILTALDVEIDESVLSGESAPVPKDATGTIFSGTSVLGGSLTAVVFRTGLRTEAGEILALATEAPEKSAFEETVTKLNGLIMKLTGASLLFVFIVQIFLRQGIAMSDRILFFVALAILMVPEALPAVVTVAFARGANLLAKRSVIVRKLSSVEELGHVSVLCVDKTGTLTEGVMKVSEIQGDEKLLEHFIASTMGKHVPRTVSGIAYDQALVAHYAGAHDRQAKILSAIPFDPIRRRSSRLLEIAGKKCIFVQGAPENVLAASARSYEGELNRHEWLKKYQAMGQAGERTLAFAFREWHGDTMDETDEKELTFLGLIGFTDELRKTAEAAIKAAEALHVEVKILTGDSIEVAESVARKAGILKKHERAISGAEFSQATRAERLTFVRECSVFARVSPEEKHAIVKLLESDGKRVAFMGDGMNDAPALRAAHVGLAVSTAADISKGAADIVLMKSDLHVIIQAIGYGREMFTNVRKYLFIVLLGHFGNFVTAALLSMFIPFLPMLPVQILLLNFITDIPMLAIATDSVDPEDRATPRAFSIKEILKVTVILGLVSSAFDFTAFLTFQALSPDSVRTLWFIVSVFTQLISIYSMRSWRPVWRATKPSLALVALSVAAASVTVALPCLAIGHRYFSFSTPTVTEVAMMAALATGYFFATEFTKLRIAGK